MHGNLISNEIRVYVEKRYKCPNEGLLDEAISYLSHSGISDQNDNREPIDPIAYLKGVMEKKNLRNKDLKAYIGSSGTICSVLKRHKPLSLRMIRNLNKYLDIPAEILIQPYDCT